MNLMEKKDKLTQLYFEYKKIVDVCLKKEEYEMALSLASALANLMYQLNFIYVDHELENIIFQCAKQFDYSKYNISVDKNTIAIYDEPGTDTRGISYIYIKALVNLGYDVIYIARDYMKDRSPLITQILEEKRGCKIYYIKRGLYQEELKDICHILYDNNVSKLFMFDYPQGVMAPLLGWTLKKTEILTYQINMTDHAFWLGAEGPDYIVEFRDYGANISRQYRKIDSNRLLKLPFYASINESIPFEGFSFDCKGKKIIFSGGSIYKTIDSQNTYYQIIRHILNVHEDIVFLFASNDKNEYIEQLMQEYPNKFYYTKERRDLFQVMKRCCFYLSTYPITGGLMGQYAVAAGKIPVTLLNHEEGKLLINNADKIKAEYFDYDECIAFIDKLILDDKYREQLEKNTEQQLVTEEEFEHNLDLIIHNNVGKDIIWKNIDIEGFTKTYLEVFDLNQLYKYIFSRRVDQLEALKKEFPSHYEKWIQYKIETDKQRTQIENR